MAINRLWGGYDVALGGLRLVCPVRATPLEACLLTRFRHERFATGSQRLC